MDPEFKKLVLTDALAASKEVGVDWLEPTGFGTPSDFYAFKVLEDTPTVHNVIVCALCSCYPRPILGNSPEWYRTPNYRRRIVRWPRPVLAEFGLQLPDDVEVRVADSNQKHRFMVMPMRPEGTDGLDRGPADRDRHPRLPDRCRAAQAGCDHQRHHRVDPGHPADREVSRRAMSAAEPTEVESVSIEVLEQIAERNQTWPVMAAKYGVENPVPPWKTSLDGLCDALDRSCDADEKLHFTFKERRDEEDVLSAPATPNLPYPENQLVALAHSLVARGVISEAELQERLAAIRARLRRGVNPDQSLGETLPATRALSAVCRGIAPVPTTGLQPGPAPNWEMVLQTQIPDFSAAR